MNGSESAREDGKSLELRHRHEIAVLRDCLGIAMRELAFIDLLSTREALRVIKHRADTAGIKLKA